MNDMSDDDLSVSESELQLALADSFSLLKRERDIAADEALALFFQLEVLNEEKDRQTHYSATPIIHSPEKFWTCSYCTFANSKNQSICEMCESPPCSSSSMTTTCTVNQKMASISTLHNSSNEIDREYYMQLEEVEEFWNATEESLIVATKTWSCHLCHTINSRDATECPQCREPKYATTRVDEEKKLWPCYKCTFDNSYADSICFMCGNPIPLRLQNLLNHTRPSECGLPGCSRNASHYGFCSQDHFDRALERNIIPPCEYGVEAVLVGETGDYTAHLLRSSHPKHASVKKQFLDSWKKGNDVPRVERIFWIRMKPEILDIFDQTKRRIDNNVQRLFHGTSQSPTCYFGTNQSKPPCIDKSCRVCSIIRTSFDLVHVKRGEGGTAWAHQTRILRYGVSFVKIGVGPYFDSRILFILANHCFFFHLKEGMYFSPISSKSNDYNNLSERTRKDERGQTRKWKCMFLCNIVLGKSYKTKEGFLPADKCPPASYDSVWGETGPHLNYDEACVYDAKQAIPSYLIVYSLA